MSHGRVIGSGNSSEACKLQQALIRGAQTAFSAAVFEDICPKILFAFVLERGHRTPPYVVLPLQAVLMWSPSQMVV